jgi:hypothetical protein
MPLRIDRPLRSSQARRGDGLTGGGRWEYVGSMRTALSRLRTLAFAAALVSAVLADGSQGIPETRRSEIVAPGIEHLEILRGGLGAGPGSDRWIIHVLVLDPARTRLVSALAMDEIAGAESVSSLAARHGALAAVNGGYFRTTGIYRGEPAGAYVAGGRVLSEPNATRMEIAVSNAGGGTRVAFAQLDVRMRAAAEGAAGRPIDGINRPREKGELVLFTPEFHATTLTPPGGLEIIVSSGRVSDIRDGTGGAAIPKDGYVLSADGAARDWARAGFTVGRRVELEVETAARPAFPFEPEWVVGAGPLLVRDGAPLGAEQADAEGFAFDFGRGRHPRTALGVRGDGAILLVTVDGRQPQKSVGMTLPELAGLMAGLGCRDAINLDGGGSTTMVVGGKVVNNPSDAAGERPVSDAWLVHPRRSEKLS